MLLLLVLVGMEVLISLTFLPYFFLNISTLESKIQTPLLFNYCLSLLRADSLLLQFGD